MGRDVPLVLPALEPRSHIGYGSDGAGNILTKVANNACDQQVWWHVGSYRYNRSNRSGKRTSMENQLKIRCMVLRDSRLITLGYLYTEGYNALTSEAISFSGR